MFDFRYYMDLLLENPQMIAKILNRATVKNQEGLLSDEKFQEIKHVLDIVPAILIKNNRIVWFLKIISSYIEGTLDSTLLGSYRFTSPVVLIDKLAEYYNQNPPIDLIEKYSVSNKTVSEVLNFFKIKKDEAVLKQKKERGVDPQEGDYILFKFQGTKAIPNDGSKEFDELPFKYAWWWINRAYCPEEGRSGKHCGNVAGKHNPDQRILSFRDNQNRVQMTFILEPDNTLGEMRANYNQKPDSRFHPYIMPLLLWDRVEGIKGAPYGLHAAFSIFDLDAKQLNELDQLKPKLIQDQTKITPFELLRNNIPNVPDNIKQKYLKYAIQTQPAIKRLMNNNTLEQWDKEIKSDKKLIPYLPEDFIPQYPNYLSLLIDRIKFDYSVLLQTPKSVQRNFAYLKPIIEKIPGVIEVISPYVKRYEELAEIAVNKDSYTFAMIPEDFRTRKICEIAVNKHAHLLEYVPEEHLTYDLYKSVITKNPYILLRVPKENQEYEKFFKIAIAGDFRIMEYIEPEYRTYDLCKIAVNTNPMALQFVPDEIKLKFSDMIYQNIINQNPLALDYVPESIKLKFSDRFYQHIINKDPQILKYVPESIKLNLSDLYYKNIINRDPYYFEMIPDKYKTYELCERVVNDNPFMLGHVPDIIKIKFPEICKTAFRKNALVLRYIPTLIQETFSERQFQDAVSTDPFLLEVIPNSIKLKFPKICKIAVDIDPVSLQFIPDEVKLKFPDICQVAINEYPSLIRFVPREVQKMIKMPDYY